MLPLKIPSMETIFSMRTLSLFLIDVAFVILLLLVLAMWPQYWPVWLAGVGLCTALHIAIYMAQKNSAP
ncbi:MAG: hypothetical protein MKZ56_06555 [Candidatus Thalassarchaeum sp.]|nr:hypothetical protein [Candidatus Thalassarchaeum sp.]